MKDDTKKLVLLITKLLGSVCAVGLCIYGIIRYIILA